MEPADDVVEATLAPDDMGLYRSVTDRLDGVLDTTHCSLGLVVNEETDDDDFGLDDDEDDVAVARLIPVKVPGGYRLAKVDPDG
jgi:hypothetical protein